MPSETDSGGELVGDIARSDLVQYQAGAVVSRTLVKKLAGTVTAFAFDAVERRSEDMAPFDARVLMVERHTEITTAVITPSILSPVSLIVTHRDMVPSKL
jgi:hypothetical protein